MKSFFYLIAYICVFILLSACKTTVEKIKPQPAIDDYRYKLEKEQQLQAAIAGNNKKQKAKHLLILRDTAIKSDSKNIDTGIFIQKLIQSIPNFINYELQQYDYGFISQAENLVNLKDALNHYVKSNSKNKAFNQHYAIVILSSRDRYNPADAMAIDKLFQQSGGKLCIYLIDMKYPHADNRLFKPHHCATALVYDKLYPQAELNHLIESIFFYDSNDEDGDGIDNSEDQCPGTANNVLITWDGCPRNSRISNPRYQIIKTKDI